MHRIRRRRNLPHIESDGAIYFVTFRLADSLPQSALHRIRQGFQRSQRIATSLEPHLSPRVEKYLDSGAGSCSLSQPRIAKLVADAIAAFAGTRYLIFAWCIMPNHVHAVIQPHGEWTLARILHSWKSYTSSAANRILNRSGEFWQRESYDHLVRDADDLSRLVRYVLENPGRAGLQNWPWVGANPIVAPAFVALASSRRF